MLDVVHAQNLDTSSVAQCLDRGLKGRLPFPLGGFLGRADREGKRAVRAGTGAILTSPCGRGEPLATHQRDSGAVLDLEIAYQGLFFSRLNKAAYVFVAHGVYFSVASVLQGPADPMLYYSTSNLLCPASSSPPSPRLPGRCPAFDRVPAVGAPGHDLAARIANVAESAFWYVLPSLPIVLVLPAKLRAGISFLASTRCRSRLNHRSVFRRGIVAGEVRDRSGRAAPAASVAREGRFSAKARPGLDPGAIRFDVGKARQTQSWSRGFDRKDLALVGAADGRVTTWDRMSPLCAACIATMTRDTRFFAKKPL